MPRGVAMLSRERIVGVAVDLADATGIDGLTMRELARALGVGPMSIYYHLPDKRSLMEAVADFLWSSVPVPDPNSPWDERMRLIASALRKVVSRHPALVPLLLTRRRTGPAGLRPVESLLRAARDAGFDARGSVRCFRVLVAFVIGLAQAEVYRSAAGLGGSQRWLKSHTAAASFPNLHEALTKSTPDAHSADQEFDFGLEILLAGFRRHARS